MRTLLEFTSLFGDIKRYCEFNNRFSISLVKHKEGYIIVNVERDGTDFRVTDSKFYAVFDQVNEVFDNMKTDLQLVHPHLKETG